MEEYSVEWFKWQWVNNSKWLGTQAIKLLAHYVRLEERYDYLIGEMAKMDTPGNYYATYALFADSLRADIREDIDKALGDK